MNPLLKDFNTAPFSKISVEDYKPAIKKAIDTLHEDLQYDYQLELDNLLDS